MQICMSIKRQIPKGMIVNERLLSDVFDINLLGKYPLSIVLGSRSLEYTCGVIVVC